MFKETPLLVIIGLFDIPGMVQAITADPDWHASAARATGYLFVGRIYWSLCFGTSRYSAFLERHTRDRCAELPSSSASAWLSTIAPGNVGL